MISKNIGAKILFLVSFILNNQSKFNKVVIYVNKYNQLVEHLIKAFGFSTLKNNIFNMDEQEGYRNLQTIKYEQEFNKIQEELVIMERRIKQKNKFNSCNIVIFSRNPHHSLKLRKELSTSTSILQKMHIHCEKIETQLLKEQITSNIYILSKSEVLNDHPHIIENCYMVIDFGVKQHVYFSDEYHSYLEKPVFISKNEALMRQSYLSLNYPGFLIRVYKKQNFLRSSTDDIMLFLQKNGIQYQYLCQKHNVKSHFLPEDIYLQTIQSSENEKQMAKLSIVNEEDAFKPNLYHVNYLKQEDTFLRSIVSIKKQLMNKESYEQERNIVFSVQQNHIWSKEGFLTTLLNFRSQISYDQKQSKQKIVCLKSYLNSSFSKISNNLNNESIQQLTKNYIEAYPNSLFVFSGNKKKGYINVKSGQTLQVSKYSPLKIYSEYPSQILVHYITQIGNNLMISSYSKVEDDSIPESQKENIKKQQKEYQITLEKQYFDISTLLFDTIWVNQGELINQFQDDYNCIIKADLNLDSIQIYSINTGNEETYTPLQKVEAFERILESARQSLINEQIEFDYYSNAKLILQKGTLIYFQY